jgi:hypothetical protein
MMNPTLHTWETVAPQTYRLAVPAGWLYRHDIVEYSAAAGRNVIAQSMMSVVYDRTAPHVVAAAPAKGSKPAKPAKPAKRTGYDRFSVIEAE